MKIWDRENNKYIEEIEYGKRKLDFLYNTIVGRVLLKTIFTTRWLSNMQALYQKSILSKRKINKFIKEYNIDMNMYNNKSEYNSFSDFFTRKRDVKKYIDKNVLDNDILISVADAKLQVFEINENSIFKIKNSIYDLKELLKDNKLSVEYKDGICLIYRLSVDDYHRYVFLDKGNIEKNYFIKGKLHTVRAISSKYNVYSTNCRNISVLNTKNFDKVIQIEVGAMLIGKINNHNISNFNKLEEKGFFDFGGSTIIQLFKKGTIKIDDDILEKSIEGIETKVKIGMRIGKTEI